MLERGANFILNNSKFDKRLSQASLEDFISKYQMKSGCILNENKKIELALSERLYEKSSKTNNFNVSKEELQGLNDLMRKSNIVITKPDNISCFIILDRRSYYEKGGFSSK